MRAHTLSTSGQVITQNPSSLSMRRNSLRTFGYLVVVDVFDVVGGPDRVHRVFRYRLHVHDGSDNVGPDTLVDVESNFLPRSVVEAFAHRPDRLPAASDVQHTLHASPPFSTRVGQNPAARPLQGDPEPVLHRIRSWRRIRHSMPSRRVKTAAAGRKWGTRRPPLGRFERRCEPRDAEGCARAQRQ